MKKIFLLLILLVSCETEEVLFEIKVTVKPEESGYSNPNGGKFFLGDQIKLNAVPNTGFTFHKWTMADDSKKILFDSINQSQVSIVIDSDVSLVANFTPKIEVVDKAFENALIELGIDDVVDGYIDKNICKDITTLNLNNKGIENLTGLEAFTSLKVLNISSNYLKSLILQKNIDLMYLDISNNQLESINLSTNVKIQYLDFNSNILNSLDISNNKELRHLDTRKNPDLSCIKIWSTYDGLSHPWNFLDGNGTDNLNINC